MSRSRGVSAHIRIIAGLLLGVAFWLTPAAAQPYPQWGNMQPGPYDVGFNVVHTHDHSRGYWSKEDYRGRRDTLETARPMQISIWYPATARPDAPRMAFGDYVDLRASALGRARETAERRAEARESLRRGPLGPYFPNGVSDDDLERVLETPTAAIRDAAPEAGPFPLVIHAGFGLMGQSVLLEYLASHGYMVATFPLLGTSPAWFHRGEGTPEAYQAGADDIGFVYGHLREFPFVDRSRTAAIGMFSANALLYQMQNMQLDALGVLDGQYPEALREVPGFDPHAVRVPLLDMPRTGFRGNRSMLDSLKYADRYVVRFDSVSHPDFYQFRRIAHPDRAGKDVTYHVIARYTRAFLDAVLKGHDEAESFLSLEPAEAGAPEGFMTLERRRGLPPAPTQEEFLLLLRQNEIEEARRAWNEAKDHVRAAELAAEDNMTTVLFFLRRDHGPESTLDAFQLLVDMYPDSWRAWEHLATTFRGASADDRAALAIKQALEELQAADLSPEERARHRERLEGHLHQ